MSNPKVKMGIASTLALVVAILMDCSDLQENDSIHKKSNSGIIAIATKDGEKEVLKGKSLSRVKARRLINITEDRKNKSLERQPNSATIKGHVTDKLSGNDIDGANVVWVGHNYGTTTDSAGKYTLHIPATTGGQQLLCSYISYQPLQTPFLPNGTVTVDFELVRSTNTSN